MDWTSCERVAKFWCNRRPTTALAGDQTHEPLSAVHPAPGRDVVAHGCHPPGRSRGLPPTAGRGIAAGGLPDDPGAHVLSGGQPGCDGLFGDGATRTPVRTGPRP